MLIKICSVQTELGNRFGLAERLLIFKQKPDFVCLPEYSLIGPSVKDYNRAALDIRDNLDYLKELSSMLGTCMIGGTVVEADENNLYNSSYLFDRGEILGRYRKLNPTSNEIKKGILPGDKLFTTEIDNVRIGIMICADALNIGLFEQMYEEKVDIIFIPTVSPYQENESLLDKYSRDEDIFVYGAQKAACFVVKTCGIGTIFGHPLQGRSLIASPWGIIKRVEPHAEQSPAVLSTILDIDEIREFAQRKRMVAETLR